jgi:hypothetical protein
MPLTEQAASDWRNAPNPPLTFNPGWPDALAASVRNKEEAGLVDYDDKGTQTTPIPPPILHIPPTTSQPEAAWNGWGSSIYAPSSTEPPSTLVTCPLCRINYPATGRPSCPECPSSETYPITDPPDCEPTPSLPPASINATLTMQSPAPSTSGFSTEDLNTPSSPEFESSSSTPDPKPPLQYRVTVVDLVSSEDLPTTSPLGDDDDEDLPEQRAQSSFRGGTAVTAAAHIRNPNSSQPNPQLVPIKVAIDTFSDVSVAHESIAYNLREVTEPSTPPTSPHLERYQQ